MRPANSEQGYVLRRLIRRAIREADKLGIKDAVLAEVAEGFGVAYAEAYPFVQNAAQTIREELEKEEAQFRKTLERGLKEFNWRLRTLESGHVVGEELPASIAFDLVTTHGFPFELVQEEAQARGMTVDKNQFENRIKAHQVQSRAGAAQKFAGGLADQAEQTVRYHTAHHILLKALQIVLGPDVHQRGSNITSERLRIDFSYGQKMTDEQKAEVEKIVNQKIAEALPVIRTDMKKEEAEKLGAEREFGANYPDIVSVYSVGPLDNAFSIEFCGGPHVSNTSELGGTFKILKEEASSAGVRRIKAVLTQD
ncbi:MAG: alanine--tRNA ligase-related protein [Patescibacteria group bacterium]